MLVAAKTLKAQLWLACATTFFFLVFLWAFSSTTATDNSGCHSPTPPEDDEDSYLQTDSASSSFSDGYVTYPAFWPLPGKEKANHSHFWSFEKGVCWDKLDDKWIMFLGDSVSRNTLSSMRFNAIEHGYNVQILRAPGAETDTKANDWTAVFHDKASTKKFYITFRFIKLDANIKLPIYFANFHEEQVRYKFPNGTTMQLQSVFNQRVSEEILKWRKRPDVIFGNVGMWYLGNLKAFKEAVELLFKLASSYGGKFVWRTVQGLGITEATTWKVHRNSAVVEQNRFASELNKRKYKFDVFDGALVSFTSALNPESVNDRHPGGFTTQEYGECVMDILCGRTGIAMPWAD